LEGYFPAVSKLCNISSIESLESKPANMVPILAGSSEFFLDILEQINTDDKINKLTKEIEYLEGFLISVNKKLQNERFMASAKPEVIELERKKKEDAEEKILVMKNQITGLRGA
jgi:valyl-tRNA synthetase